MNPRQGEFYISGGTLPPAAPCYVERNADRRLCEGLRRGEFCYVLTSRQMGKSSLMVRTAARLREEGTTVVVLDLTALGRNLTAEQWYRGLLEQLGSRLDLEDELETFWLDHRHLGPLQRWMGALEHCVLGVGNPGEEHESAKERKSRPGFDGSVAIGPCSGGSTDSLLTSGQDFSLIPSRFLTFALSRSQSPEPEHRTPNTEHRLVIFIDEIDTVRSLPFSTDEFFAAIREC